MRDLCFFRPERDFAAPSTYLSASKEMEHTLGNTYIGKLHTQQRIQARQGTTAVNTISLSVPWRARVSSRPAERSSTMRQNRITTTSLQQFSGLTRWSRWHHILGDVSTCTFYPQQGYPPAPYLYSLSLVSGAPIYHRAFCCTRFPVKKK